MTSLSKNHGICNLLWLDLKMGRMVNAEVEKSGQEQPEMFSMPCKRMLILFYRNECVNAGMFRREMMEDQHSRKHFYSAHNVLWNDQKQKAEKAPAQISPQYQ